jgi:hypothetical protein
MTQTDRVYQLLRRRGEAGITVADFIGPETADGGPTVSRLAARVGQLRHERGLNIVAEGRRGGYVIYRLREEQRLTVPAPAVAPIEPGQLVPAAPPRSALLGWEDAA